LIGSELIESFLCFLLNPSSIASWWKHFNWKNYRNLLYSNWHQSGTNLFSAAMARMDWILIGWLLNRIRVAEYSFSYKAYEVATLPFLALAPLLITSFTRYYRKDSVTNHTFFRNLAFGGSLLGGWIALILNIIWIPLVDTFTHQRYGAVNAEVVLLLSACIPLSFLNNLLWSSHFALGRTKMILKVFAFTFLINLSADLFLIPLLGNKGAAAGYLLALFIQTLVYAYYAKQKELPLDIPVLKIVSSVLLVALLSKWMSLMAGSLFFQMVLATLTYIFLAILLGILHAFLFPAKQLFSFSKATS
jgi:O-antigen/teichoic acid export membrane protein